MRHKESLEIKVAQGEFAVSGTVTDGPVVRGRWCKVAHRHGWWWWWGWGCDTGYSMRPYTWCLERHMLARADGAQRDAGW